MLETTANLFGFRENLSIELCVFSLNRVSVQHNNSNAIVLRVFSHCLQVISLNIFYPTVSSQLAQFKSKTKERDVMKSLAKLKLTHCKEFKETVAKIQGKTAD